MSNDEKNKVREVYGKHQLEAENIWLKNITTFNKLDLQLIPRSYHNVIRDCIKFADDKYLDTVIKSLKKEGLITDLNITELSIVLPLAYNRPANFSRTKNKAGVKMFATAINKHSYNDLLSAINTTKGYSVDNAIKQLKSLEFKKYYNEFHFPNL